MSLSIVSSGISSMGDDSALIAGLPEMDCNSGRNRCSMYYTVNHDFEEKSMITGTGSDLLDRSQTSHSNININPQKLFEYPTSAAKFIHASSADESFLSNPYELHKEIIRLKLGMAQLQSNLDTQETISYRISEERCKIKRELAVTMEQRDMFKDKYMKLHEEYSTLKGGSKKKQGFFKRISEGVNINSASTRSIKVGIIPQDDRMKVNQTAMRSYMPGRISHNDEMTANNVPVRDGKAGFKPPNDEMRSKNISLRGTETDSVSTNKGTSISDKENTGLFRRIRGGIRASTYSTWSSIVSVNSASSRKKVPGVVLFGNKDKNTVAKCKDVSRGYSIS